jgi:hypothetical protein
VEAAPTFNITCSFWITRLMIKRIHQYFSLRNLKSEIDSAVQFGSESFDAELATEGLTVEGLVTGRNIIYLIPGFVLLKKEPVFGAVLMKKVTNQS